MYQCNQCNQWNIADLKEAYCVGCQKKKENFRNMDLTGADLTNKDLTGADFTGANLRHAKLIGVDLTGANLTNADLTAANLSSVVLTKANITGANLTNTDLTGTNLIDIDLTKANITGANLRHAKLIGAPLIKKTKQINEKFGNKQFDFNEGLESVIEVIYGAPRESKVKLFFSTDDFTTFSRNYIEEFTDNFVRLIIHPSTRANASLISGGNFDFDDSFDKGYSLFVSMKYEDSELLAVISNILRSENFGCLPSRFTISAHRNDDFPTKYQAVEILSKLNGKLSTAISEMK